MTLYMIVLFRHMMGLRSIVSQPVDAAVLPYGISKVIFIERGSI